MFPPLFRIFYLILKFEKFMAEKIYVKKYEKFRTYTALPIFGYFKIPSPR